jgi:hypothetical protein
MSLPNYLSKIKSAGIYRFVFDKSEVPGNDAETLRLVVGYSEKGPFNTLVYVESISEFDSIFGSVNKKLERRGCFFHRLAEQALMAGPILVINLKPFNTDKNNPELVTAASFNVTDKVSDHLAQLGIEDIYDTTRLWHLEPEGLGARFAERQDTPQKYITITAADSSETTNTVFFRGYHPKGYDISFKEWYSSVLNGEELPSFLEGHEMDKVSEYFAECYIFRGKFTKEVATSEALAKYFDVDSTGNVTVKPYILNAFGEPKDTLAALAQDTNSNFVNSYSGILLPNFMTSSGSYISLDLMFNAGYDNHKMMMNLNVDALYDGEISIEKLNTTGWEQVGKQLSAGKTLSGEGDNKVELSSMSCEKITPVVVTGTFNRETGNWEYGDPNVGTYADPDFYMFNLDNHTVDGYTLIDGPEMSQIGNVGDKFIVKTEDATDSDVAVLTKIESGDDYMVTAPENNQAINDTVKKSLTGTPYAKQPYGISVAAPESTTTAFLTIPEGATISNVKVMSYASGSETPVASYYTWTLVENETRKYSTTISAGTYDLIMWTDTPGEYSLAFASSTETKKTVKISFNEPQKQTKFVFDKKLATESGNTSALYQGLIRCNHPVFDTCQGMVPVAFDGYVYGLSLPTSDMMSKKNWQKEVINTLTKYEGIRLALTNRKDAEYHYLVDTFESFVDTELKSTFGVIAKEKDNCLAIINFPSMKTFKECPYSSYTDQNGKFQTKYIADGYNKQKPASVYFSLMSEFNGASFVSYNTPIVLTDGTIKTTCPSAALVSNNFMAKYDTRLPYSIVAGPTYGRISVNGLVGPDFNFSRADLDILEPMGVNCMVYVPRKGTYINSNQTAKQNPVTALSKINVRELVIFLQDEIENLMQSYQWEYNTQELRDTIKSKADTICEKIKANGGLYEYINVCDDSNNTPEVIDNEMIILDTSIEPGRGAGKMVQRLYIYRTGALKAMMS